jgi:hypothetical protein
MPLTWSTTAKNAHALLSNGNLTVTTDGTVSTEISGRADDGCGILASQRIYVEFNINGFNGTGNKRAVGIANATLTYPNGAQLGFDANLSCGGYGSTGIFINSAQPGSLVFTNFGTGDVVGMAVDTNSNLIWFRTNGGQWNGDVIGNQNPAVGSQVGGASISAITGTLFPAYTVWDAAGTMDQYTLVISGFGTAAPTGFSSITSGDTLMGQAVM